VVNAVVNACDALDGLVDGLVSNVAACHFKPETVRCPGGADTGDTCLSDAQIASIRVYGRRSSFRIAPAAASSSTLDSTFSSART